MTGKVEPWFARALTHLRHVIRSDVLDLELDVFALVADDARRGDVAVVDEAEGFGPFHRVSGQVEVDWRLLSPCRAGAGPI